jgi:uncharacterized protein
MKPSDSVRQTEHWLRGFVIRLGLCPFASLPYQQKRIRITECGSTDASDISHKLLEEARRLLVVSSDSLETTLVVIPEGLTDFFAYLEVAEMIEEQFIQQGYEGVLQIATFHPNYRFADSLPDDPADFTNRSPFPMFHLIREDSITAAVETYPGIEEIPERNKALLRKMGHNDIKQWLSNILKTDSHE